MLKRIKNWFSSSSSENDPETTEGLVAFTDEERGNIVVMDAAVAERLESKAPPPSQRSFALMLESVRRVHVIDGGMARGKAQGKDVLLETDDVAVIAALRESLAIHDGSIGHCMCLGSPTIELYDGQRMTAAIGLHHGRSIRWEAWGGDAQLRNAGMLCRWLAERGVPGPNEEYERTQREVREAVEEKQRAAERKERWKSAMPACVASFWDEMQKPKVELSPIRSALEITYPDPGVRARILFEWLGSSDGPWNAAPDYESVVELLLLEYPTTVLAVALADGVWTPAHMNGAIRYFAAWRFSQKKRGELSALPNELKQTLLSHARASRYDEGKLLKVQRAFGS